MGEEAESEPYLEIKESQAPSLIARSGTYFDSTLSSY